MRILPLIVLLILATVPAQAQSWTSQSMRQGAVDYGLYAGGGLGLASSSNSQFFFAGARIGRVITQDHLPRWLHGNFEYAAEFNPWFEVFQPGGAVYGGSFTPIILKWNFTANSRIVPYLQLSGGGLVTSQDFPRGNTSYFNFMAGGSGGVHIFLRPKRALTLETHWIHISNADLGTTNPNLAVSFFVTLGYTWFK